MGVYKEAAHYLEDKAKRQIQIYPDAADWGIPVTSAQSPECREIRDSLKDKFLFGKLKKYRREYRNNRTISVIVTVYLPWETVSPNQIRCTKWDIIYIDDLIRKVRFIQFNPTNEIMFKNQIWEK